ncbi:MULTISPECIES: relaxase/mobilization nuclease domain-containing protein [Lactococcus]|uniref:relaxase/mobilization nuclease domain-containing protein n=1 Tax=Lactococcus TaxID=1357 RepID=UPI003241E525
MATTHIKRSSSSSRLVNYAEKRAVQKNGYNLDIDYAKSEFKQVREIYGNKGETQAYASRLAFSPKEFNPKNVQDQLKALEIAKEIYSTAYPNQQVAMYVHNDTKSLHVHAVIGAIDLETGKKMHGNWQEYREKLVKITDKVVKKHGLEVTVPKPRAEKHSMAEIKMKERGQLTWKDKIRQAIDSTMREAHIIDFKSFKSKLKEKSVDVVERGRELTYKLTGTNYKSRGAKLGDDYKKETIFNELDRRTELQYGRTSERQGRAWLEGRGKRVEQEQQARSELTKRAERVQRESLETAQRTARERKASLAKSQERGYGGPSL